LESRKARRGFLFAQGWLNLNRLSNQNIQ